MGNCREKSDFEEEELAVRNIVELLGGFLGPLEGVPMHSQRAASLQVPPPPDACHCCLEE